MWAGEKDLLIPAAHLNMQPSPETKLLEKLLVWVRIRSHLVLYSSTLGHRSSASAILQHSGNQTERIQEC